MGLHIVNTCELGGLCYDYAYSACCGVVGHQHVSWSEGFGMKFVLVLNTTLHTSEMDPIASLLSIQQFMTE